MADDDKKTGDDKGKEKDKTLTTDEIDAIAKKVEETLKAEDAAKDKTGDDKDKTGDDKDDDDFEIDPKNIDTDKTLKYIDKLKDENAKRRIANKKSEEKLTKLSTELQSAMEALNAATTKLKEVDTKTQAEKDKEASDLANAQKTIEDLQTKMSTLEDEAAKSRQELVKTNKRVIVQDRENMITRLVQQKEVAFASDFEREGLIKTLTEMDDEGFSKNNDEVIYEVMKFIKDKKASEDKTTPGPGPGNRKTSTPVGDEIQALLKEKNLNVEQKARLDELLALSGQA